MSLSVKNMLGGSGKGFYAWKRRKKKTIYDNGTQYEPLSTFQYISNPSESPTGSTTFSSDSIVCACSSGAIVQGAVTDNPIDFAGYSKISIECEISTNNAIYGMVGVSSDKIMPSGSKTLRVNSADGTVRTEISYDIPSDVNNKYIVFGVQNGWKLSTDNTVKVYRVWLEASEEYVIDNNPDKYPDGAEKDGYWYEKVGDGIDISKLGCTKFEEGSFTPSSDTYVYNATHSLGVIPKFAIVYGGIISGSYVCWQTFPITTSGESRGACVSGGTGSYTSSYAATFTSSKAELQINSGGKFKAGIEYHYLLLA